MRILSRHPNVELTQLFAESSAGMLVSEVLAGVATSAHNARFEQTPLLAKAKEFEPTPLLAKERGRGEVDADICFLALPHGEAMHIAPALLEQGKIVIDLSGDHRLKDRALYERYYKKPQTSPVLDEAVYGLPEWNAEAIQNARFIANPGCYATSVILALAPLVAEGALDAQSIIVNSMSGVSGAGRKASLEYSFVEVNENVKAYKIGDHQHIPEIETVLGTIANDDVKITFTPHLIPITRGIYTTICATLAAPLTEFELSSIYSKHYSEKPFVRMTEHAPEIRRVANTNFIDIFTQLLPERNQVMIISTEDNLVKGAAGQAVQNMNLVCGFPETEGLL